jgi:hypothetical protein
VSVRLVAEALDHAPAELTPSERLVLLVLAEDANNKTRTCSPGMDVLTRRTGLTEDGVRKVLQQLAARGHELRVPVGIDTHGRPIYAKRGHRTTYRIPELRPARAELGSTPVPPNGPS